MEIMHLSSDRKLGIIHPTAKPIYKKPDLDDDGRETGIIVVMGMESGEGVLMALNVPAAVSDDQLREWMETALENEQKNDCKYCEEANQFLDIVRTRRSQPEIANDEDFILALKAAIDRRKQDPDEKVEQKDEDSGFELPDLSVFLIDPRELIENLLD